MIIELKSVEHFDRQINVMVEFSHGDHVVKENMTFYDAATPQTLVAAVKASAKRLYEAAVTANTFESYIGRQYNYDFATDTLTEV
jgi:hypothetical protein